MRLIVRFSMFLGISRSLSNLGSCIPLRGFVPLILHGLTRDLCVPFWSSVECFLAQSLFLLGPCLDKAHRRNPHPFSFETLTPEFSVDCPSPSSRFSWRRHRIFSAPRFENFTVPAVQTRAQSHWETIRSSDRVRFTWSLRPHIVCDVSG